MFSTADGETKFISNPGGSIISMYVKANQYFGDRLDTPGCWMEQRAKKKGELSFRAFKWVKGNFSD